MSLYEQLIHHTQITYEPRSEKTGLRDFRLGLTQTRLYNHTRWLEAGNFEFRKQRNCTFLEVLST